MKATGIVRRIDDLGRVVIPKEIRRTLRIREGDPLEIFTDREGEIILKKYSPIGELAAFAGMYADSLAKEAGIDYVKANHLEVIDGFLTGKVYGEIVTKDVKVAKLKDWAAENGLKLSQTIAMGDGANDLPMIKTAGIGIAFCAKPIVRAQAPYQITEPDLYKVIEILDEVGK